ncbi:CheY-like chemotaxis protein [Bradyrhizobium sp. AZCC 2230]
MQGAVVVILIVEDDQLVRELVTDALSEGGFETEATTIGEEAVTRLRGDTSKYEPSSRIYICLAHSTDGKSGTAPES